MRENICILSSVPIFRGLNSKEISKVDSICIDKSYIKGKTIFIEGDRAEGFYIIIKGKIKIYKISLEGKEQILHMYGVGDFFGEVPVFAGGRFPANAIALMQSHLLFLPRAKFLMLITENPLLSMSMLAELSSRLRQFTLQIESLSLKDTSSRLASYLLFLVKKQKNKKNIKLNMSKGDLANFLGVAPETLSRIFTKMTDMSLVKVKINDIEVINYDMLVELGSFGKR